MNLMRFTREMRTQTTKESIECFRHVSSTMVIEWNLSTTEKKIQTTGIQFMLTICYEISNAKCETKNYFVRATQHKLYIFRYNITKWTFYLPVLEYVMTIILTSVIAAVWIYDKNFRYFMLTRPNLLLVEYFHGFTFTTMSVK